MNLFLEGPIRIGKSTALQNILRPIQAKVGGFAVQRLWQDGAISGFRCVALDGKFPKLDVIFPSSTSKKDEIFEDVFIYQREFRPDVLKHSLSKALKYAASDQCQIILLDEIGGQELMHPEIIHLLTEFFKLEKPRCGVLKSLFQVEQFATDPIAAKQIYKEREILCERITKNGLIYSVDPFSLPSAEQALQDRINNWLERTGNQDPVIRHAFN
ncbi:MAG TPA: hypothetical protein GX717_05630 [Clostridiaceae bacterium]|nr:hypothetical protein [Clostridiaceae bacterium]